MQPRSSFGKAMVVCMSRRICVDLYNAIIKLRPEWHSDDDKQGVVKIVMTGNATDPEGWQSHIRNKKRREDMALRFRTVARVDVDDSGDLTNRFGIQSVPTLLVFRGRRVVDRLVGAAPDEEIIRLLLRHLD